MKILDTLPCVVCKKENFTIVCECGNKFCICCKKENFLEDKKKKTFFVHCNQCGHTESLDGLEDEEDEFILSKKIW